MASPQTARRVLVGLVLVALGVTVLLAWPFAKLLVTAAAVAGALSGVQLGLTRRLRGRRGLAAGLLTGAVFVAVVLPLGALVAFVVRNAILAAAWVRAALESGGLSGLVTKLPASLQGVAGSALERVRGALQESEGLLGGLGARGLEAAAALQGALAATAGAVLSVGLFLLALFFLLSDGPRLVAWIEDVAPLAPGQARTLLREFRRSTSAVLRSSILTALVQAVVALGGYFIARVPQALFLGLVTFVFALVPALGAAFVVIVTGVLMLVSGHPVGGIFLLVWGIGVVGVVDNVVKPMLIKGGMEVHGAVIFFALFGGLAVFGPVGLILGPLAIAFLLALVRLTRETNVSQRPLVDAHGEAMPAVREDERPATH